MVNQHKDEGLLSKKWALTLTIMIYNKNLPKQIAAEKSVETAPHNYFTVIYLGTDSQYSPL